MMGHEQNCVRTRLGGDAIELLTANVLEKPVPSELLRQVDAVVIGGSGDFSVHHPDSSAWVSSLRNTLEEVLSLGMAGFGICFGHQLLGMHLGADVRTIAEHGELGTVSVALSDEGKSDPVFGALPARFTVQTGHSDHVSKTPDQVVLLAENPTLQTQAFRVKGLSFYSTQFHPDMTAAEARFRYLGYRDAFGHKVAEEAQKQADRFRLAPDDGALLLESFAAHLRNGS